MNKEESGGNLLRRKQGRTDRRSEDSNILWMWKKSRRKIRRRGALESKEKLCSTRGNGKTDRKKKKSAYLKATG